MKTKHCERQYPNQSSKWECKNVYNRSLWHSVNICRLSHCKTTNIPLSVVPFFHGTFSFILYSYPTTYYTFLFFFSGNIHLKMRAIWNRKDKIAVGVIYLLNVGPGVGAKDEKKNRKYTNRQEKCFPPCLAFVATYALIRKIPDRGDSLNFMFQFYGLRLHFCIPDLYENKYKYHYLYKKRRKKRTKQNMRTRQT